MRNELILLSSGVSTHLLRGVGTVGIDGVTVENMVVNGDFSDGITKWSLTNGTSSVADKTATLLCNGTSPMQLESGLFKIYINHKYYLTALIKATSNQVGLSRAGNNASGIVHTGSNNYERLSIIQPSTRTTNTTMRIRDERTSGWDNVYVKNCMAIDLTAAGLADKTVDEIDALVQSGYFSGTKTFGGVGCLVSKDSAESETGRMYFETTPMYSNATLKDVLAYDGGKYYHTHNVDSDGVAIAEPYDTEVDTNGQFLALSEGTVTYEPWYPDIAIYTDKFTLTKAITAVKELYKYGSETPITDAVIAGDGLSFTSASLTAGDLAYGVFEFDEPLRPLMTIKRRSRKLWTDGGVGMNEIFMELLRHKIEQGQIEAEDLPQEVREQLADTTG